MEFNWRLLREDKRKFGWVVVRWPTMTTTRLNEWMQTAEQLKQTLWYLDALVLAWTRLG
jgi:hypothetical protein